MRISVLREHINFLRWCLHPIGNVSVGISTIDWQELLSFAKKQTIAGIYWQGIPRIGEVTNKPIEDDVMDWMGEYTKIAKRNAKTNDFVIRLAKFMQSNDVGIFVFK